MSSKGKKRCPDCGTILQALLFLGVEPEGYICPKCKVWMNEDLKILAQVIC